MREYEKDCRAIDDAFEIAMNVHRGQRRRNEDGPYIIHPLRVAAMCAIPFSSPFRPADEDRLKAVAVAIMHDVIEDGDQDLSEVLFESGFQASYPEVWEAVEAISRKDDEPYESYIQRVKKNRLATIVKLNDLMDNSRDLPKEDSLRERYGRAIKTLLEGSY